MLSEASFQNFIHRIYDAAEHPAKWRELYEELRVALGVKSIHMLATDHQHGTLSYSDGANLPVQGELAYMQRYRFIDPRLPLVLKRPVGEWAHCHEELGEDVVARDPFYQEFLLPYDRRYVSGCKLVETPQATVILSVLNGVADGPLRGAPLQFVDRLLPHLQRAARIGIQNFVYSHQALVGQMLVNKLRQPVILMTPGGDVMHTNEAAQEMMRTTRLVQVDAGRLQLPPLQMRELLAECAAWEERLKADPRPGSAGAMPEDFRSLRITASGAGGGAEVMYGFYTLLSPQGTMGTFGLRPLVMLLFYHPASASPIDGSLLYAVFGLSPAESRIARLLAEGLTLKEIAEAQGTQHDTVRKQLRSIYQKTATNRQPDLVRLLLHLPHNAIQPR